MTQLRLTILCLGVAGLIAAGCKKDAAPAPPADPPPSEGGNVVSLTGGGTPNAVVVPTGPVKEVEVDFSNAAPPEKQVAAVVETANAAYFQAEGAAGVPKDAVELLNRAVQVYGERRQETDDGDGPTWPVISDLNQLVRYRILRALPAAPAGKKFALDPKTKVVSLTDK